MLVKTPADKKKKKITVWETMRLKIANLTTYLAY